MPLIADTLSPKQPLAATLASTIGEVSASGEPLAAAAEPAPEGLSGARLELWRLSVQLVEAQAALARAQAPVRRLRAFAADETAAAEDLERRRARDADALE
jgi:hypothetical protein